MSGDSRPPVYWDPEVERWVYRAYSLGNCIRSLRAFREGVTPADHPDWLLKAFDEGTRNENVILSMLYDTDNGYPWRHVAGESQQLIEVPVGTTALIRGHNDDIAMARPTVSGPPTGQLRVVEAKAFAPSTYEAWKAKGWEGFPYYAVQMGFYMGALKMPGLFVIGIKDEETRVVTKLDVMTVDTPPMTLAAIKARVAKVEQAERLPGCDFKQYPCQMFFIGDENGCKGEAATRSVVDGRRLPKATSEKRLAEIDLEAQLRDSVRLEQLNSPAEMIFEGTRMRNQGAGMVRQGEEMLAEWRMENPKLAGEDGEVRRWTTTKWHITEHPVGGVAVRPKRED